MTLTHKEQSISPQWSSTGHEEDYHQKMESVCSCMHSMNNYGREKHHMCALFNFKYERLIVGESIPRQSDKYPFSIHAEANALHRAKKVYNKHPKYYDACVIRLSKTAGRMGNSRPCYHCILAMRNDPVIKIRYVYYSTNDGRILRERLATMLSSEKTCMSSGALYRQRIYANREEGSTAVC
jgi:cytidine deaminase